MTIILLKLLYLLLYLHCVAVDLYHSATILINKLLEYAFTQITVLKSP